MNKPAPTQTSGQSKLRKGERTALQIMDVAERMFAEKGFQATSLREIASEVGIAEPGLYRHFAHKEDLYQRVMERGFAPLAALLEGFIRQAPTPSQLRLLPAQVMDLLATHPHLARLFQQTVNAPRTSINAHNNTHNNNNTTTNNTMDKWLQKLLLAGVAVQSQAANNKLAQDEIVIKVIALFNICTGYFSSAQLIEGLCNKPTTDPHLLDLQKKLLTDITRQWL